MIRALIELTFMVVIIIGLRALLTSFFKGVSGATASQRRMKDAATGSPISAAGELHKDPVCGTYVAESSPYQKQAGGQTFYYCSAKCREEHELVARR